MKAKTKKSLDQLKKELQVLTREEMKKISGGRPAIRWNARRSPHCGDRLPQ